MASPVVSVVNVATTKFDFARAFRVGTVSYAKIDCGERLIDCGERLRTQRLFAKYAESILNGFPMSMNVFPYQDRCANFCYR